MGLSICLTFVVSKKVSSALQPPNPHSWGNLGVPFLSFFLHNSLMSILQDIFKDHYEEMIYTLHPRASVIENVKKMVNCGGSSALKGDRAYESRHRETTQKIYE